jgi:hypothetical protein
MSSCVNQDIFSGRAKNCRFFFLTGNNFDTKFFSDFGLSNQGIFVGIFFIRNRTKIPGHNPHT